jgi:hypothetical protein
LEVVHLRPASRGDIRSAVGGAGIEHEHEIDVRTDAFETSPDASRLVTDD